MWVVHCRDAAGERAQSPPELAEPAPALPARMQLSACGVVHAEARRRFPILVGAVRRAGDFTQRRGQAGK